MTGLAPAASWAKTFSTSVCLIPPRSSGVWPRIQEVRLFHDKSFTRWPPHINLLYPFVEAAHFQEAAQLCQEALQLVQSFPVTLQELEWFEHGRSSCTLWARPDAEELAGVQAALVRAFPQCTDLSNDPGRGITAFTPHLSIGQWRGRADVAAAAAAQRAAAWQQPAAFEAGGVALISRAGYEEPFCVRWFVPFGGGDPVALDVPYIATVGEPCQAAMPAAALVPQATADPAAAPEAAGAGTAAAALAAAAPAAAADPREYGLGGARQDGTVWSFAYGANMCPRKLNGVRGIQPLESLPAQLPGWRLSFTHRGAMGNVQPLGAGEEAAGAAGVSAVHGVLHRLSAADYGRLINMEHEYRPVEVMVQPYDQGMPPVPAVVLTTPEDCLIADGLPPSQRYLELLQEGAQHWQLDARYVQWLSSLQSVDSRQRGEAYYTAAASGQPLPALPKIRTGSQPRQQRGRGRGRGQGGQQGVRRGAQKQRQEQEKVRA